jgi:HTH-type transcriptional regulator/antitoxin MqsA
MELIHGTRDLPYIYKGETIMTLAVTADFCPACDESITDRDQVMREMQAFNKQVNAVIKNKITIEEMMEGFRKLRESHGGEKITATIDEIQEAIANEYIEHGMRALK